ncbi:MAG: isocitrate lyase/phosphoenolpyruvate mutase family protein [Acidimicrobiales bacterium]
MIRPATSILDLLHGDHAAILIGVHNAMIAKVAEEAGADGLWISSFELHAAARLPDADILGPEDYNDVVSKIVDRVSIPVLVDGNAGGGNAINTIRLVREFEKFGAAGICIEDNIFPKRCSFYEGMQSEIEAASTFRGKIQAALEKRTDPGFAVIARTEALIKGLGMAVALDRAKQYAAEGAEGILIHHKEKDPGPVLEFADAWYRTETTPLVCVPTTYNTVSYEELDAAGFKLIIFANYGIRAIVKTLQETFGTLMKNRRLADANDSVVSMEEIFRLIYVDELKANEDRYVR